MTIKELKKLSKGTLVVVKGEKRPVKFDSLIKALDYGKFDSIIIV